LLPDPKKQMKQVTANEKIAPGPNPWKVVIILEELGVPYEIVSFKFDDVKKEPFIKLNPNGRVPGTHLLGPSCGRSETTADDNSYRGSQHELDAVGVWRYCSVPY
jgi:hypothetical protein